MRAKAAASNQPSKKADAGDAERDGPAFAQKILHWLSERLRRAEIAVDGSAQVACIEMQDVVLGGAFGAECMEAFRAQAGIELALVGVKTGGQAHQRRGKQSAEQHERCD